MNGGWRHRLGCGELYNLKDFGEPSTVAAMNAEVIEKMKQLVAAVDKDLGIDDVGPDCRPWAAFPMHDR